MSAFSEYVRDIRKNLERGDSTEHTHRPALKALLESVGKDIVATNEPRRIACGAPDFNITRNGVPLGHVETKDPGVNLDEMERGKGPNGDQFKDIPRCPTGFSPTTWSSAGMRQARNA